MDSEVISQTFGHHNHPSNNESEPYFPERRSSVIESSKDFYKDDYNYSIKDDLKPTCSVSTPSISQQEHTNALDATERIQFLREMEQAREELAEFRRNMEGLVKQMDGISVDLEKSKDRVSEIEQDLTATEEVNVNLQVLLERAVKTQKESDVFATQAIRNMYSDLASVVYENSQLQGRLVSIENHQREQEGSVHDVIKRMFEYTQMLEQAQGTIHMLQEPRLVKSTTSSSSTSTSRRNSVMSFYNTDDDDLSVVSTGTKRSNYIQSPPLGPQSTLLKPQQGLRMLFDNHGGLSSLAKK
ncbi:hypothetical protein HPULCUR_001873 [Helicostylum pulchrum]|uniref:Uncharacterized protein n=1 Tax=Helicostylum pulchrum TaxID=562976 RepID=A0ABP9XNZ1_9FUNG